MSLSISAPPTEQELESFRLLEWVENAATLAEPGTAPDLRPLFANLASETERERIRATVRELNAQGLVHLDESMGFEGSSCQPTESGRRALGEFKRERSSAPQRARTARRAILHWLYDQSVEGVIQPNTDEFRGSALDNHFGLAYSDREIARALDWLDENGLIKTTRDRGQMVVRASITNLGEDRMESGEPLGDGGLRVTGGNRINIYGSNNQVSAESPGSIQHLEINEDARNLVVKTGDSLLELLPKLGLSPSATEDARNIAGVLNHLAGEANPDRGLLRSFLERAKTVAVSGTGSAVGAAIVTLATQALSALSG